MSRASRTRAPRRLRWHRSSWATRRSGTLEEEPPAAGFYAQDKGIGDGMYGVESCSGQGHVLVLC